MQDSLKWVHEGEIMEVILSYLENMFLNMPQTPEVVRAKEELASMMEDKYNELLAEGKKENEAVGIVISEFGDLEELSEELGLKKGNQNMGAGFAGAGDQRGNTAYGTAGSREGSIGHGGFGDQRESTAYEAAGSYGGSMYYGSAPRIVSRQEAQEYIELSGKTSKRIAVGVMLCIYSPIFLLLCGGISDGLKELSDAQIVCFGVVPLFLLIAIAVAIFIYNGMKMDQFEYLKKEVIWIDERLDRELAERAEKGKPEATLKIIIGVVLCIFSVIPFLIGASLTDNDMIHAFTCSIMMLLIGIAVALFIVGANEMECIKVLRQEGDFASNRKKGSNKVVDAIAGVYWPVVTVIYLAWSFITMQWGITWIIWPIAGVLFGAIAAICGAVGSVEKKL